VRHPTGMAAAQPPEVTESAKEAEAANEYADGESRVALYHLAAAISANPRKRRSICELTGAPLKTAGQGPRW
jgi:hypothetical protein